MKQFLVFIVLLASSFCKSLACGYSPYGEDIRYCLFKPDYFGYSHYKAFYYNANLWGFDYDQNPNNYKPHVDANIMDWYYFTQEKVSLDAIEDFNTNLSLTDIHPKSTNAFLAYLYQNKKTEAIEYLKIAKNCEAINNFFTEDTWERNAVANNKDRSILIQKLIRITEKQKNPYFKRKYAFLTIRLAYYAGKMEVLKTVFEQNFNSSTKDYLYNWGLFFYTFTKSGGELMVNAANLMANCPEKNYASYYYFHVDFKIQVALQYAKTKEEIANVYAFASVQKVDKTLDYLKEIYKKNPKSEILGFLLLREINKIEDWVYTPYYSNYLPSTQYNLWSDYNDKITTETLRNRSENDRLYAQEVLNFIQSIDLKTTQNPIIWEAAQINLQFITRKYEDCLKQITLFEKTYKGNNILEEIEKIKALCFTANQENGKAIIKPEIQNVILKYKKDERFIFALGRELEFKGNITDGIVLISLLETNYGNGYDASDVEWQANRINTSGNLQVFYSYFDYLDFVYAAQDLQTIVTKFKTGFTTEFEKVIYGKLLKDKDYLTDLLGTKYIRENELDMALLTFKSIDKKYWQDNYNAWERGNYGEEYSFDQNPFYDFKYTQDFIKHKDKFLVTKLAITQHLIQYTNLAYNSKTKNRDYYYFLLANCYYNMSDYGNSWMMRRYSSSSSYYGQEFEKESYIDEIEYRNKIKAVAYYKLAFQNGKTAKFKALCLRMMDYAEKNTFSTSKRVTEQFPEFSSDLSGCENLENYFKSR
ncbi:hypothetical protein [Flavobacterium restrictum]|uniref:Tetratricopeptide repeat protein n=1 Tax=Flavobacterium restrictum TaxID=2594428 RepID=A0A553E8L2_9FLAO|nr:hypothetical protein [Flavobacterium restrictum]TRX41408.1 hypothetical protein FNW21_04730 [Flavobacterium restrictum]